MYKNYIKRFLDIIFSLIFALPIVLVVIICGLLIKIEDGGPIFYSAKRLGKGGQDFKMLKLRSMRDDAPDIRNPDGSTFNSNDDPRLTKIGKFVRRTSLDELPQIFNVLMGDMSFIGPRPDLPEHINYYEEDEIRKLEVLPGISGYNQAYYRNTVGWREKLKNDVYYVDNISFWLDLKILFRTIKGVILLKGIYSISQSDNVKGEDNNERF